MRAVATLGACVESSVVRPERVSRRKIPGSPSALSRSTLPAVEVKATWRPSAETVGCVDIPSAERPLAPFARLTRDVRPVRRSCSQTLERSVLGRPSRAAGREAKTTYRPVVEMAGSKAKTPVPPLIIFVVLRCRSRTKMRELRPVAPRFAAADAKATKRPLAESVGWLESPLAIAPRDPFARLTKTVGAVLKRPCVDLDAPVTASGRVREDQRAAVGRDARLVRRAKAALRDELRARMGSIKQP